jgi:hypothetical protein
MWRKQLARIDIAASWARARAEMAACAAERDVLRREVAELERERDQALDQLRETAQTLRELQAVVLEHHRCTVDLLTVRRERALLRAKRVERDPTQPLH